MSGGLTSACNPSVDQTVAMIHCSKQSSATAGLVEGADKQRGQCNAGSYVMASIIMLLNTHCTQRSSGNSSFSYMTKQIVSKSIKHIMTAWKETNESTKKYKTSCAYSHSRYCKNKQTKNVPLSQQLKKVLQTFFFLRAFVLLTVLIPQISAIKPIKYNFKKAALIVKSWGVLLSLVVGALLTCCDVVWVTLMHILSASYRAESVVCLRIQRGGMWKRF